MQDNMASSRGIPHYNQMATGLHNTPSCGGFICERVDHTPVILGARPHCHFGRRLFQQLLALV